jgi:hypothetical protein
MSYREILHVGTERCCDQLNDLRDKEPGDLRHLLPEKFQAILEIMGRTLCRLTRSDLPQHENIHDGWRFYFWPGYDSWLFRTPTPRFTLKHDYNGERIQMGAAVCPACVDRDFDRCPDCSRVSLTAAAYQAVLQKPDRGEADHLGGVPFVPGGTHSWLEVSGMVLPDQTTLTLLSVILSSSAKAATAADGLARVSIVEGQWLDWGRTLAAQLNNAAIIRARTQWPAPVSRVADNTYPSELYPSHVQHVRECLYNIWLAGTFADDTERVQHGISASIDDLQGWLTENGYSRSELAHLLRRAEQLIDPRNLSLNGIRTDPFRFWYSIVLEAAPKPPTNRVDDDDSAGSRTGALGSAMALTTYAIEPELLYLAQQWVRSVYLMMRLFESNYLADQAGTDIVRLGFMHEIKKIAEPLTRDWIRPLSESGLFHVEIQGGEESSVSGRLGTVRLSNATGIDASQIALTPAYELILPLGRLLRFWSMSDKQSDLPFTIQPDWTFAQLANCCWEISRDGMLIHALKTQPLETAADVTVFYEYLNLLRQVFGIQLPRLTEGSLNPRLLTAMPRNEAGTIWLARLLTAIFNNCIEHGDPTVPITINLSVIGPALRLTILNNHYPGLEGLQHRLHACSTFPPERVPRLAALVDAAHAGRRLLRPLTSSYRTVELCLGELGRHLSSHSTIVIWPGSDADGPVCTEVEFPREILEVVL